VRAPRIQCAAVGLDRQGRVDCTHRLVNIAALQLITGQACIRPGKRFGSSGTGRVNCLVYQINRAVQIARQPAKVCGARIRLVERFEIDHPLVRIGGFGETSLLHQHVAEQAVIQDELPLRTSVRAIASAS
jgi:hypothetical protein